jgi:hypothetical protein
MGQYYKVVFLDADGKVVGSMGYFGCAKLMEHSWNTCLGWLEEFIGPGGPFAEYRMVWAGDYADPEPGSACNLYSLVNEEMTTGTGAAVAHAACLRYAVNLPSHEFVDVSEFVAAHDGLHPVSLLTCEGNGRGGGDYYGTYPHVGRWARCVVNLQDTPPPADFECLGV